MTNTKLRENILKVKLVNSKEENNILLEICKIIESSSRNQHIFCDVRSTNIFYVS